MIELREVPGQTCSPSARQAVFQCRCGKEFAARRSNVKSGRTGSCGCSKFTHRLGKHPLYLSWHNMMARCYNEEHPRFPGWGGRGIKVCERWHDVRNFITDMDPRPAGHTLDREDNNGDYCPENCRWATPKQQANNRRPRKDTRRLTIGGETRTLTGWSKLADVKYATIYNRLNRGWSNEEAVFGKSRLTFNPHELLFNDAETVGTGGGLTLTTEQDIPLWQIRHQRRTAETTTC